MLPSAGFSERMLALPSMAALPHQSCSLIPRLLVVVSTACTCVDFSEISQNPDIHWYIMISVITWVLYRRPLAHENTVTSFVDSSHFFCSEERLGGG